MAPTPALRKHLQWVWSDGAASTLSYRQYWPEPHITLANQIQWRLDLWPKQRNCSVIITPKICARITEEELFPLQEERDKEIPDSHI